VGDFLEYLGFLSSIGIAIDSVGNHEYQNKKITPNYSSPKTLIGKHPHSADQLAWVDIFGVKRTRNFQRQCGKEFFQQDVDLQDRINWVSNTPSDDAMTVILRGQLFAYTGRDRFGTKAAQEMAEKMKGQLYAEVLKIAEEEGLRLRLKN